MRLQVLLKHCPKANHVLLLWWRWNLAKCTAPTLDKRHRIVGVFGEYQEMNVDKDPESFKASTIPDALYWCQLLHGMASGTLNKCNDAFYVVALLQKILHVVHVWIGSLMQEQYISVITNLVRPHLNWTREGVVPAMAFEAASHAVNQHSVQCTFNLWRALCRLLDYRARRDTSSGRLPPYSRGGGYLEQGKRPYQCL